MLAYRRDMHNTHDMHGLRFATRNCFAGRLRLLPTLPLPPSSTPALSLSLPLLLFDLECLNKLKDLLKLRGHELADPLDGE